MELSTGQRRLKQDIYWVFWENRRKSMKNAGLNEVHVFVSQDGRDAC